jgi:desulfoferrodoxin (superoxide reductase-like protein)
VVTLQVCTHLLSIRSFHCYLYHTWPLPRVSESHHHFSNTMYCTFTVTEAVTCTIRDLCHVSLRVTSTTSLTLCTVHSLWLKRLPVPYVTSVTCLKVTSSIYCNCKYRTFTVMYTLSYIVCDLCHMSLTVTSNTSLTLCTVHSLWRQRLPVPYVTSVTCLTVTSSSYCNCKYRTFTVMYSTLCPLSYVTSSHLYFVLVWKGWINPLTPNDL